MTIVPPTLLAGTGTALRLLVALNVVLGLLIAALFLTSLLAPAWVLTALGPGADAGSTILLALQAMMVIGMAGCALAYFTLVKLLGIVATVRAGDPFVRDNAARLQAMAWLLLAMQLLHLGVGAAEAAASAATPGYDMDWSFSGVGWLSVLLLFVLARVFAHGADMRDDLDATV